MKPILLGLLDDSLFTREVKWESRKFAAGEKIIHEGGLDKNVYIILAGTVSVRTSIPVQANLARDTGIAKLSEGEVFGELSMFDNEVNSADVVADGEVEVAVFEAATLNRFLQSHTDYGYRVLRYFVELLVKRMRQNNIRASSITAWYLRACTEDE